MKSKLFTIILSALVIIFALVAWTANPSDRVEPGSVTVSGEAEVRVVPDEVILTLGVETWDENLAIAKRQNDDKVKAILALAQKYGVESKYIQTDFINIEPRYEDNYKKNYLIGYFVRKTIVITLKDISKFEDVLTGALGAGANYVHGVQFRTTELRKYRDEARSLAIKAAKEKAVALSGELDQKVGKTRSIQEDQLGWWSSYSSWWGSSYWSGGNAMTQNVIQESGNSGNFALEDALAPGQITVKARVTVSFELE
jgi:uncharacterized protein YggE